jgi:transcriptional regulator with XRE-family HTH domain
MSSKGNKIDIRVGDAVRRRRQELGLALRPLASKSEVSASMISEIERGAKSPTVSTLCRLADAMGVPVSALIEAGRQAPPGIRVARWTKAKVPARKSTPRLDLTPAIPGSNLEFLHYTVPPRAVAGPFAAHPRGTIEHVHLLKGALRVVCGDDEVSLTAGDTCSCYTDVPHSFDNRKSGAHASLFVVVEPALDNRRT